MEVTLVHIDEPMAPTQYQPKAGHHIPHSTTHKHTDKEHDKYQSICNYSDETIIKHSY